MFTKFVFVIFYEGSLSMSIGQGTNFKTTEPYVIRPWLLICKTKGANAARFKYSRPSKMS